MVDSKFIGHITRACGILFLLVVLGLGITVAYLRIQSRNRLILWEEVVRKLQASELNEEGFWVGDVTELYRLGRISRELAEADTAPLNPLVPTPIPFHGYYVRMMESGPSTTTLNDIPTPLKGQKRSRETFAICIYPAEAGPDKPAWITCSFGMFRRTPGANQPVLQFPSLAERQAHWAIID